MKTWGRCKKILKDMRHGMHLKISWKLAECCLKIIWMPTNFSLSVHFEWHLFPAAEAASPPVMIDAITVMICDAATVKGDFLRISIFWGSIFFLVTWFRTQNPSNLWDVFFCPRCEDIPGSCATSGLNVPKNKEHKMQHDMKMFWASKKVFLNI